MADGISPQEVVQSMNNTTGIKFAHEMLVDIFGALIPGILFLFGILMSVGLPLCLLLSVCTNMVSENKSDWLWVLAFLLFLILAYTIGHIFYRKDIKVPDRKDVRREQHKKLKVLISTLKSIDDSQRNLKILELLKSEIEPLFKGLKIVLEETETVNTQGGWSIEKSIRERRLNYDNKLKQSCDDSLKYLNSISEEEIDNTNCENGETGFLPWCIINVIFPEIGKEYEDYAPFDLIPIDSLSVGAIDLYESYLSHTNNLREVIKNNGGNTYSYHLAVCYLILHLQNESGCATEARCDFPYLSYYKYLLKRQMLDILEHVDWQLAELRTKNKLNQYKIEIQIKEPNIYSILAKNESHIRMASSSWYVCLLLRNISILVIVSLIIIMVLWGYRAYSNEHGIILVEEFFKLFEKHQEKPLLSNVILSFIVPAFILIGASYIKRQVIKFIHYQRLREIYYTLKVYHECVGRKKII